MGESCSILFPLYAVLVGTAISLMVLSFVKIFKRKRPSYCNTDNVFHNGRTKFADETEDMYHSLHSLSIGYTSDKKSRCVKSWLKTVEDMNYLGTERLDVSPTNFTNEPGSIQKLHSPTSGQLLPNKLSNGRVLIRPARFRVRRCSINSATAALSLTDNGVTYCNTFNSTLHKESKQPLVSSSMSELENRSLFPKKTVMNEKTIDKDRQTFRTANWLITTVIIVSVSSNIFLFLLLIFNVYKT